MNQDPKIGYDNIFERGTVSVTSEETGFEKENAYDWLTDDFWKPTAGGTQRISVNMGVATTVDYVAIAAHDLYTQGGSIRVQNSTDGVSWFNVSDEITPADNSPIMVEFTPDSAQYWAIRTTTPASDAPSLGVIALGEIMDIPIGFFVGHAPLRLNPVNKYLNSTSENGQFVGRSVVRRGVSGDISLEHLDPAWVRTTWQAFADHAETKGFFWAWYYTRYPLEVAYVWSTGDPQAQHSHQNFMSVSLPFNGRVT